ncbi:Tyrosine recombinase XerC [Mycolicibacterium obuense]|uniref:Tyrosine recombinase XerC n=2 Tax=Mycolicibacterium obuense TaxID=1807 RepID=A0A0J6VTB2_9MYCO|nr:Tyrosine recombinase XerC [Mycolicibacterium obuense]
MSTQAHHDQASLFSDGTSTRRYPGHVLPYGLGLDSTAVLLRWLTDPSSRNFDLSDLVVITAMTGDEFSATGADVERYVLPELRRHRVRFVQVGRNQLLTTAAGEGITTFSDTTEPDRLFIEGAYALSTEMLTAGTLPQRGGARKCSARAKGAVLDPVIARLTGGQPYQHYVGFEVDETGRAERDAAYNTERRTGRYPLIQWGWTRADCDTFVYNLTGRRWLKSACSYCLMWNKTYCGDMEEVAWERFPAVGAHEQGRRWLQFTANIGRAANTVDAYGRALQDYLIFCAAAAGADPVTARADVVAAWIGDMRTRVNEHSGTRGLSDSTVQQRVVAVRGFYDFLVEDEVRERNPVRRGQAGRQGKQPRRGLVRVAQKAPWIPDEQAWERILEAAGADTLRNRLMFCLAYDGALRRQELVSLHIGDVEPAWSLIHVRAETTKSQRARTVAFGANSAQLLVAYMRQRTDTFGKVDGTLFLSTSRRNHGAGVGASAWSKTVTDIAGRAQVPKLSTHTLRHLRLTDLARAGWDLDEIAQYAGHRDLSTTLTYIHLSGRELAAKFHAASTSVRADQERRLAALASMW